MPAKIVSIILIAVITLTASCKKSDEFIEVKSTDKGVFVGINNLAEKTPVFYKTELNGAEFEFFVVKINGEVKPFLNRCRRCYRSGLGFSFDKTHIRCKTCNEKFLIEDIPQGVGSCYPIPLPAKVEGEQLAIDFNSLRFKTYK